MGPSLEINVEAMKSFQTSCTDKRDFNLCGSRALG